MVLKSPWEPECGQCLMQQSAFWTGDLPWLTGSSGQLLQAAVGLAALQGPRHHFSPLGQNRELLFPQGLSLTRSAVT